MARAWTRNGGSCWCLLPSANLAYKKPTYLLTVPRKTPKPPPLKGGELHEGQPSQDRESKNPSTVGLHCIQGKELCVLLLLIAFQTSALSSLLQLRVWCIKTLGLHPGPRWLLKLVGKNARLKNSRPLRGCNPLGRSCEPGSYGSNWPKPC